MLTTHAAACRRHAIALLLGGLGLTGSSSASAFQLVAPTPWIAEGPAGDPQQAAPCGADLSVCYQPTGAVTTYTAGQEITLDWVETAPSDGWFRIALSYNNRADLMDPAVAVDDAGLATDAAISLPADPDAAPLGITTFALPVLADGLFPHTAADLPGVPYRYTWNLILPNQTCDRCTLQVTQFLANKSGPGGHFAHHCADITILPAADPDAATHPYGMSAALDDAGGPGPACATVGPDGTDGGVASASASEGGAVGALDAAGSVAVEDAARGTGSGAAPDATTADGSPTDVAASGKANGGCGCDVAPDDRPTALLGMGGSLAIAALARRRYRRAR